ncbi:MAG: hypothetical protein WCJ30_11070, partial [Deltaproteobacteria bacterium]
MNTQATACRVRPQTLARLHASVANSFGFSTNDGWRSDGPFHISGLRHLGYHLDVYELSSGTVGALNALLSDETFRAAQRSALGAAATLLDLRRGIGGAIRADRADWLCLYLAHYAAEDHLARQGLGRLVSARRSGDLRKVLGVLQDSRRPDLMRALVAWEALVRIDAGLDVEGPLRDAIKQGPRTGAGAWHILADAIEGRLPEAWDIVATASVLPQEAQDIDLTVGLQDLTPLRDLSNCGRDRLRLAFEHTCADDSGQRALIAAGWLRALGTAVASDPTMLDVSVLLLEQLLEIAWQDVEWTVIAEAVSRQLVAALERRDVDVLAWFDKVLTRVRSDYFGAKTRVVRALVRVQPGRERFGALVQIVTRHALELPEPRYRCAVIAPLVEHLAALLVAHAEWRPADDVIEALVQVEAASLPRPTTDFLRFALGRWTARHDRRSAFRALFGSIESHWVRGALLRKLDAGAHTAMRTESLLEDIDHPMAQALAFQTIYALRAAALNAAECRLALQRAANELPQHFAANVATLLTGWKDREDLPDLLADLWRLHATALQSLGLAPISRPAAISRSWTSSGMHRASRNADEPSHATTAVLIS